MPGLGEEALGLGGIEPVEFLALGSELIDRDRPLGEGGRDNRVGCPVSLREGERLEHLRDVGGAPHRPPDPEVAEGRVRELEPDGAAGEPGVLGGLQAGLPLPGQRRVEPPHGVLVLGPEVGPAGEPCGQARGRVLVDEHVDAIRVRQPGDEVVRVAQVDELDVRLPAFEHPGPGADDGLDLLEVAELLHAFLGDDPGRGRREEVQEPGVRLLERELDRVLVDGVDPVDVLEHRLVGVARDREETLVGVLDVGGGQLAPVHRRLGVPAHALPELEDVGRVVLLGPRLGEVGLDRVGHRPHGRARLHLHEAAIHERQRHHRQERDRLMRVEVQRVRQDRQAEQPAPLRRLRLGGRRRMV